MSDWQSIDTYDKAKWFVHVLLCHKEHRWIRFGRYYPEFRAWYYSGTNERSQYSSVRGDEPTHWMPIPELP